MIYKTGSAFRQALEHHIREIYLDQNIPLTRLRKFIAFDRFLSRLFKLNPNNWIIKGGLNLEIRLGQFARTTKDIDLLSLERPNNIFDLLLTSSKINLNDFFEFLVHRPIRNTFDLTTGTRYSVNSYLDGRLFEQFHVDIGVNDKLIEPPELLKMHSYLSFAEIDNTVFPCYSINQQIAEKLHAMTRTYISGESSRVKDFVDILILASAYDLDFKKLKNAIVITFKNRNTHPLPTCINGLKTSFQKTYSNLAAQVGLRIEGIEEANTVLSNLILPILLNKSLKKWDPRKYTWK